MNQMDVIINLENIKNCESVAALMVRSGGLICHTNVDNNYSQALLITESLGKKGVVNYALDSVYENTYSIALGLVQDAEPILKKLDEYFEKNKRKIKLRVSCEERTRAEGCQTDRRILVYEPGNGRVGCGCPKHSQI